MMILLQIPLEKDDPLFFIADNIQTITIVVTILLISAFIFSIIKSAREDKEKESIVENWKNENKAIFNGKINLIGGGNFLNVKEFSINGFFYEMEDRFISTDGKAYYKNAIESTDLKKI
jgi:hypothetical protein